MTKVNIWLSLQTKTDKPLPVSVYWEKKSIGLVCMVNEEGF